MIKNHKQYEKLNKLLEPLTPYHVLPTSSEETARITLCDFMKGFVRLKPDKKFFIGFRDSSASYLINLLPMHEALRNKQYALACHELLTLQAYEPILQIRIYVNILKLYEDFLR